MNAADLVVLPYLDILNSGSAIWALSFGRPVLLPNRGAMPELAESVGSDWVRLFDGPLDEHQLADALNWARRPRPEPLPALDSLDPERVVEAHLEAYGALAGARAEAGVGAGADA